LPRRFAPRNDPAGGTGDGRTLVWESVLRRPPPGHSETVRRLSWESVLRRPPAGSFRDSPQTVVGIRSPPGAFSYLQTCKDEETDCHVASLLAMTRRGGTGDGRTHRCAPTDIDEPWWIGPMRASGPTDVDGPRCNSAGLSKNFLYFESPRRKYTRSCNRSVLY
jgi:hypothetical protein